MRKGFRQFVAGVDLNSGTPDGVLFGAGQADRHGNAAGHGSLGLHTRRSRFGHSIRKIMERI
jgi:hypothetical protein